MILHRKFLKNSLHLRFIHRPSNSPEAKVNSNVECLEIINTDSGWSRYDPAATCAIVTTM